MSGFPNFPATDFPVGASQFDSQISRYYLEGGAGGTDFMADPAPTPAHLAAQRVANPEQRKMLENAADYAAKRTPTEVRDIERGIANAVAGRVRRG